MSREVRKDNLKDNWMEENMKHDNTASMAGNEEKTAQQEMLQTEKEEREQREENRMGVEPIRGLLLKMSFPLMISMLVQSAYNIVDSIFVAHLNENALTAVSMCFPVQSLMMAFAIGTAVGMSALISRYLGARKFEKANKVAQNGFFLAFVSYALFLIIGSASRPFMAFQTDNEQIIEYGATYLRIVCLLSIMVFLQLVVERLMQSTGKTAFILLIQGSGAIINIILDPILIFGLLGAPKLGVAGAAIATVFGQTFGAVLGLILNIKYNKELTLNFRGFRPNLAIIKEIYHIGIPSIIMQSVGSVMVLFLNLILAAFSTTAVAAFGAYFKLQSFIFMPVFGLNNGVVPLIAYNYGAHKKARLVEAGRISTKYAACIMVVGVALFWTIPQVFLSFFGASEQMLEIGVPALRTIAIGFPIAGYAIMKGSMFQALGKSIYSMNISIVRQLVVLIPAAYLLSRLGNVNYVWWAFPIAEALGVILSILYTKKIRREMIDVL